MLQNAAFITFTVSELLTDDNNKRPYSGKNLFILEKAIPI